MFRLSVLIKLAFIPVFIALFFQPLESNNVFLLPDPSNDLLNPRILLVTAHPDDEAFFFAPTILSLLKHGHRPSTDGHGKGPAFLFPEVYSLCLSTGDADGLGKTRIKELERSLDILGIEPGRRWIVDSP
jgi:N-acetylglucosaminylphosphatidylinositol deacetylase